MLGDALRFPKSGDDWLPTLIIGGVVSLLGVLVLPTFILQGYFVRVMHAAATDEAATPSFKQWGSLFVDGLKLFVVNLVYGLAVAVPLGVAALAVGFTESAASQLVAAAVMLVVVAVVLLVVYLLPAAYANFAIEGSLGAAFDFGTIRAGAFTSRYAVGWLLAVVVAVVGGALGTALSLLVVGIFVLFYVQVVTYYLWARGFAEGLSRRRSYRLG